MVIVASFRVGDREAVGAPVERVFVSYTHLINKVDPLWTRKPADITEEQYKEFYHELYPMSDEPLFSIHLNIDYPFHLTDVYKRQTLRSSWRRC